MTDPIPSITLQKRIRDAIYTAQAVNGGPVGYNDIGKEIRDMAPESLSRYLRSMCKVKRFGIIKLDNGTYMIDRLQYQNALQRFI